MVFSPNDATSRSERVSAATVARDYHVSVKTIRDIWTGRTWIREIVHLDPVRSAMVKRLKLPGRPSGSTNIVSRRAPNLSEPRAEADGSAPDAIRVALARQQLSRSERRPAYIRRMIRVGSRSPAPIRRAGGDIGDVADAPSAVANRRSGSS
jgi:hypothetical protein